MDRPASRDALYRETVLRVMEEYHAPGAAVGVWTPGRPAWRTAEGLADVATGRKVSLDDRFVIGSVTKSFTVGLVLMLANQGRLSLHDPIGKYVDGVPNGETITLANLAGMTSGVKNYTESPAFLSRFTADFAAPWTAREIVDAALPESPVFAPGTEYNYSNTNTILLGMVVEQVVGRPLADVYQARILNPLGLRNTSYPETAVLPSPHAQPYLVDPETGEVEAAPAVNLTSLGAAGGLVSTIDDLGRWGRALGTGALVGSNVRQLTGRFSRPATDGPEYDVYGLGIGRLKGYWGHSAQALGFQAATFYNPADGTVIAVAVNSSQTAHVAVEIFKALADAVASGRRR